VTTATSWPRVRLGEIGQSLIGLTYRPDNVKRSGTLVLRSSNVQDGRLAFDDNVYVDSPIPERIRVQENDILICVRNGSRRLIGKSVLLDRRVVRQTFGAFMAVFRSDANPFLQYFFQSGDFKRQIDEHLGATINQITNGSLNSFAVALPSAAEQRVIVAKLQDIDRLVTTLERLIAKRQAIKQGMMQQLLTGKTRLPGFTEPWQPRRLGNMLGYEQPGRYLVQTSQQLDAGRVPVLTAGKTFILGYTNEADGIYTAHPVVIFDDFTTASKYVDFDFKAKSSAMKILSARPGVDLRFIYECMQLIDFPLGDHKRYWISEYSKQELDVPSHSEQRAISAIVTDADEEVDLLRRRLAKARATKTGMMQQLLTGRARLPAEAAS